MSLFSDEFELDKCISDQAKPNLTQLSNELKIHCGQISHEYADMIVLDSSISSRLKTNGWDYALCEEFITYADYDYEENSYDVTVHVDDFLSASVHSDRIEPRKCLCPKSVAHQRITLFKCLTLFIAPLLIICLSYWKLYKGIGKVFLQFDCIDKFDSMKARIQQSEHRERQTITMFKYNDQLSGTSCF